MKRFPEDFSKEELAAMVTKSQAALFRCGELLDEARRLAAEWRDNAWGGMSNAAKDPHTWDECGFDLPWEVEK